MRFSEFFSGYLLVCTAVCVLCSVTLRAQDRIDPVGMGKARASVATSRGLSSIGSNPGNLDLPAIASTTLQQPVTFTIYSAGGSMGTTYLSVTDYKQVFTNNFKGLTNEERERIGTLLEQDERLVGNGAVNLLTLRWKTRQGGTLAVHYGHRAFARVNFPPDFATLVATSNIASHNYNFTNRGFGGDWVTEFGVSYGLTLGDAQTKGWFPMCGIGAGVKLMQGIVHFDLSENSIITVDQTNVNGTLGFIVRGGYQFRSSVPNGFVPEDAIGDFMSGLFPASSGSGVGADVGIGGVLFRTEDGRDAAFFGIALQDIGSITWDANTKLRSITNIHDTLSSTTLRNDQFAKYQGRLDSIPGFTTDLPSLLRIGFGINLSALNNASSPLILEAEGEFPLNDIPGNAPNARLSVGMDWEASKAVALRTGLTIGGTGTDLGLGLGVGLRPLDWCTIDIGLGDLVALANGNRIDAAFRIAFGL